MRAIIALMDTNISRNEGKKKKKVLKGAPGFEPGTSRSAVECSTTELYPRPWRVVTSDEFIKSSVYVHFRYVVNNVITRPCWLVYLSE